ncbi:MAG: energy transducer TonB [Bacteroidota bacterium]
MHIRPGLLPGLVPLVLLLLLSGCARGTAIEAPPARSLQAAMAPPPDGMCDNDSPRTNPSMQPPAFVQGNRQGLRDLQSRFRIPDEAQAASDQIGSGRILVQYTVGTDGAVYGMQVTSEPYGYGLEAEAMAAVAPSRYISGRMDGEPVCVKMNLPFDFHLR